MGIYTNIFRPVLFSLDPDVVHEAIGEMGSIIGNINLGLVKLLKRDCLTSVSQAVGSKI